MKRALVLFLIVVFVQSLAAQEYGTKFRKDYEKEANGPHGECSVDWTTLQPGLEHRKITCLGDEDDLDLHVVRVDTDRWDLDTAVFSRATARWVARRNEASFTINANFFDHSYNPLGVVVKSGDIVSSPRTSSWQSIFLIDDEGVPHIVMPKKWKSWRDRTEMAVQAGPRLVVAGHTNRVGNTYAAARAGVCIRKNGELLFFATPQNRKLHVTEIARVTRRDEIDGGLACRDAMLFDGGHSVNFFAEGDDERVSVEGDPVPVFIFATRHKESDNSQAK